MAVTFDTKFEKGATGQASPFSFVSNAGTVAGSVGANSNRVLIGGVCFRGVGAGASAVAMTWNGIGMTPIGTKVNVGASVEELFLFGLIAPDTGAQTLSVSWTGGTASPVILGAISLYDADQSTGWQNQTSNGGTTTSVTVAVTSANGNMAVGVFGDDNANGTGYSVTAGTGDWNERAFDGNYGAVHNASSGASTNLTITISDVDRAWGIDAVDVIAFTAGNSSSVSPSVSSSVSLSPSRSPSPSSSLSASPSPTPSSSPSPSPAGLIVMERTVFDYVD